MHFLPIAERELRLVARRPRTYWTRLTAAVVAVLFSGYLLWVFVHALGGAGSGRQVFLMLVQIGFIYCLFAGVGSTADCLSSEKREGTLGFLFLTDLKGYDIIAGKLVATSLHTVYGMLSTVPAFGLCLLLGGIQAGEFWRTVLALLNTLFFSLATGLFVSTLSREQRRATQSASGLMVLFGFVLPGLGEWLRLRSGWSELGLWLRMLSPTGMVDYSTIPTSSARYFWWSLCTVHLLSWLLLFLASWWLPYAWQDKAKGGSAISWKERWQQWSLGSAARRRAIRLTLLDRNPFCWLAVRAGSIVWETWLILVLIIGLGVAAGWYWSQTVPVFVISVIAAATLHTVVKMQICSAACQRLGEDKEAGTLEVLLATPLTVREIIRGQWLALWRQLAGPLGAVVLLDLCLLWVVLALRERSFFSEPGMVEGTVWVCALAILMLIQDAVALGWVGMWQAVAAKSVLQARSKAIYRILFLPWVLLLFCVTWVAVQQPRGLGFPGLLATWFILGTAVNVFYIRSARFHLYSDFRVLATERFQPASARSNARSRWRPFWRMADCVV